MLKDFVDLMPSDVTLVVEETEVRRGQLLQPTLPQTIVPLEEGQRIAARLSKLGITSLDIDTALFSAATKIGRATNCTDYMQTKEKLVETLALVDSLLGKGGIEVDIFGDEVNQNGLFSQENNSDLNQTAVRKAAILRLLGFGFDEKLQPVDRAARKIQNCKNGIFSTDLFRSNRYPLSLVRFRDLLNIGGQTIASVRERLVFERSV